MSEEKISSEEVPNKFNEWLLAMGCPAENVPNLDSAKQMCRGQYYIVWRSLMDEVEPKEQIKLKRRIVFLDDIQSINDKNDFSKNKASVIEPDELVLWRDDLNLKENVTDIQARMAQAKEDLIHVIDKVSSKLSLLNNISHQTKDIERRVSLLQKTTESLEAKKSDLLETINIANSLSYFEKDVETEGKLDKCISLLRLQNRSSVTSQSLHLAANPIACSSMASTTSEVDNEELLASLVKCRGDALWPQLYERRAGLCVALSEACAKHSPNNTEKMTPQSALALTAALHCTIVLETMKNQVHVRQKQKLLATAIAQLDDYLNGDACEYLVLNCERTRAQSRVNALKALLDDVTSREGVFEPPLRHNGDKIGSRRQISNIDKTICSKKEELKKLLQSLAVTESKISNAKKGLEGVFTCLQSGAQVNEMDRFKGLISLPDVSIATLRRFYEEAPTKQKKIDMSLDLDLSANNSSIDFTDNMNPTFIDELKIYLDRFCLEKNRKLVLESGEKIWIFETLQSSIERIHSSWQAEELCYSLLCPSVSCKKNLQRLSNEILWRNQLEAIIQKLERSSNEHLVDIDISSRIVEENEIIDKIKKHLNENLIRLQKIHRNLDIVLENIEYWTSNEMKKFISSRRNVQGMTYRDYETLYLRSLKL